jgi:hypothetical protein
MLDMPFCKFYISILVPMHTNLCTNHGDTSRHQRGPMLGGADSVSSQPCHGAPSSSSELYRTSCDTNAPGSGVPCRLLLNTSPRCRPGTAGPSRRGSPRSQALTVRTSSVKSPDAVSRPATRGSSEQCTVFADTGLVGISLPSWSVECRGGPNIPTPVGLHQKLFCLLCVLRWRTAFSRMIEVVLNDRLGKKVRVKCKYVPSFEFLFVYYVCILCLCLDLLFWSLLHASCMLFLEVF